MFRVMRLATIVALLAYGAAAPAAPDASASAKSKKDPNEVVCEKQEVLGSRLASKRICMTRAEWAEQRHSDREAVDRSQTGTCVRQAGC